MRIKWWHIAIFISIIIAIALVLHPTKLRTGWMLHESEKTLEAIEKLLEVYKKNPKNFRAIKYLASGYEKAGKIEKASEFFDKLIEVRPSDQYFNEVTRFYAWAALPKQELKAYEKWYNSRIKNRKYFNDKDGRYILQQIYAFYLFYQDYEKAINILKERRKVEKNKLRQLNNDLVTLYERTGQLRETIDLLEVLIEKDPKNKYAFKKFLNLAPIAEKTDIAEKLLRKRLERDPKDPDIWTEYINFELRIKNFNKANELYLAWMETRPCDKDIQKNYLNWLIAHNEQKVAIAYIENMPKNMLMDKYYTQTLFQLYEWNSVKEKLLPVYLRKFQENPRDKENTKKTIGLLYDLKLFKTLKKVLIKLLTIYPYDKEYTLELLGIYDTEKNTSAAIALLKDLAFKLNDPNLLFDLSERYLWANDNESAKKIFEDLLAKNYTKPIIYRYLGDIYLSKPNFEQAELYFTKYKEASPKDYYAYYQLGEIFWATKRYDEAKKEFETALLYVPASTKDQSIDLHKAKMYALLGDKDFSDNIFKDLITLYPKNTDIINTFIETLMETKRYDYAFKVTNLYIPVFPQNFRLNRNLARLYAQKKKYTKAENIYASLLAKHPNDKSLKIDYAYLQYEMGNWYEAKPIFDEIAKLEPNNKDIQAVLDEIFKLYRPRLHWGMAMIKSGPEDRYGPYVRHVYPFNSKWTFDAAYTTNLDSTNVIGYDPNYNVTTNQLNTLMHYRPHYSTKLDFGVLTQMIDRHFAPAPIINADWQNGTVGRFNLYFIYNKRLNDPVSALYFNGKQDRLNTFYEKTFIERIYFMALYESNWYRVNGTKIGRGGGDEIGREDVFGGALIFLVHKKPDIRLGYNFNYSKLHVVNNYLDVIPLIRESARHDIIFTFFHEWNKWLTTDFGAFVGNDPKRQLYLKDLDLYGFRMSQRIKFSKRFEVLGNYEYSSEDILNNLGRYQRADIDFLYRF